MTEPGPPALTDDDGGAPLFNATNLKPGDVRTECVEVKLESGAPAVVGVAASATGTGLDDALDVVIEAGVGGRFGDCSGFTGSEVYRGTVADLVRSHPDADALDAWSATTDGERRTFRFQVRLNDGAQVQDQSAVARLAWHARPLSSPTPGAAPPVSSATPVPPSSTPTPAPPSSTPTPAPPAPTPSPAAPPDETPTPAPTVEPDPRPDPEPTGGGAGNERAPGADAASGSSDAPASPRPDPAASAPAAPVATQSGDASGSVLSGAAGGDSEDSQRDRSGRPERTADAGPSKRGAAAEEIGAADAVPPPGRARTRRSLASRARDAVTRAANTAARLAEPAAERAAFPAILLLIVGLFALLQNRIDARDPKLALAPVHRSPDLPFEPFRGDEEPPL